jgi:hypothetical protein
MSDPEYDPYGLNPISRFGSVCPYPDEIAAEINEIDSKIVRSFTSPPTQKRKIASVMGA